MTHSQITSFIWSFADLIRDTFKRGKYQDVILPLTVLRRIDQVLEPTKEKVLKTYSEFKGRLDNPDDLLRKASGYAFYNNCRGFDYEVLDDPRVAPHTQPPDPARRPAPHLVIENSCERKYSNVQQKVGC